MSKPRKPPPRSTTDRRKALMEEIARATRASSTAGVLLHGAIAERLGLSASEHKTLEILDRLGSRTAGELARDTGLTTAAVTSLIDRLEAKGFARRVRSDEDRRRVNVEPTGAQATELAAIFGPFQKGLAASLERYSDGELAAIADFMTRSAAWAREQTEALSRK